MICSRSVFLGAWLAAAAALNVGCDNSVTGPDGNSQAWTPNLTGTWSGTVRESGASDGYSCPPRVRNVTVRISQASASIRFRLPSGSTCSGAGAEDFVGTLSGNSLTGSLSKEVEGTSCVLGGGSRGTGDTSRIVLDGLLAGACNAVMLHVELARSSRPEYVGSSTR
jgi:hypothetical protein